MSDQYKISSNSLYFITMTTVGWIDIFTRSIYCDEVIKSLNYCIMNKGLNVYAFCIMSNHVHLIINSNSQNLSDILRDLKGYTSKRILKIVETNSAESRREWLLYMFKFFGHRKANITTYQLWQHGNHAFELYSNKLIDQKIDYIHNNPVVAGIVAKPHHYVYSSANNYTELKLSHL